MPSSRLRVASRAVPTAAAAVALGLVVTGSAVADQPKAAAPPSVTVTVGSNPSELVWSKRNHAVYVLNDGSVSVIDTRTLRETAEFGTGFDDQTALGLTRQQRLLVGTFDEPVLKLVGPRVQKVLDQVRIGPGATGIATARPRTAELAFVSLLTSRQVVVVNARSLRVVDRITLPRGPQTIQATPDGEQLWVGSSYSGRVWVIDAKSRTVVRRINVDDAGPVSSIAFDPRGKRAWVAGLGGVQVVNTRTGRELAFLPAPRLFPAAQAVNIGEIAIVPRGHRAIVLNSTFPDAPRRGVAAVVNTRTLRVTKRIRLGTEPLGLSVSPRRTYVSNFQDDTVSSFPTPGS